MNRTVLITAVIVIIAVIAVIAVFLIPKLMIKGPSLQTLYTEGANATFTGDYEYLVYSNILGQVQSQNYLMVYSQQGPFDRYVMVVTTTTPQQSLYLVMTRLSNGSLIQCIAEPLASACQVTNETFNLVLLLVPSINTSLFRFVGTQEIMNNTAYCYESINKTMLGNIIPEAYSVGLGSLPVNVTELMCLTSDGIPLLIKEMTYGNVAMGGFMSSFNLTQTIIAIGIERNVYLSNNATLLLSALGINETAG